MRGLPASALSARLKLRRVKVNTSKQAFPNLNNSSSLRQQYKALRPESPKRQVTSPAACMVRSTCSKLISGIFCSRDASQKHLDTSRPWYSWLHLPDG